MVVDPLLIVGVILLIFLLLIANVYILIYWQHPDDKNESIWLKVLIIVGLQVAEMSVLLIPIDVANNAGDVACEQDRTNECGGIDMRSFWEAMLCFVIALLILFIPYATFYYEAEDGMTQLTSLAKTWRAAKGEILVIIVSLLVLLSCYFTVAQVDVPVTEYVYQLNDLSVSSIVVTDDYSPLNLITAPITIVEEDTSYEKNDEYIFYTADFAVYIIALIGWVGWWVFALLTGVGLAALPFDLIVNYIYRPRGLAADEMAQMQMDLQKRTEELIELSTFMKKDRNRFVRSGASKKEKIKRLAIDHTEVGRLAQMVYMLEKDMENFRACKVASESFNPLIPIGKLILGVVCMGISGLWLVHIILYILIKPQVSLFLNDFFEWFNLWFPIFGALFYALFALYLLFCMMKGLFKCGIRFMCFRVHPMTLGATYTNAFLFNVAVVLLCTIPCVHFCTTAFSGYVQYTDIFQIFEVQVRYLHFFSNFHRHNVFIWILFLMAPLSLLWLLCSPKDKPASPLELRQMIERRAAST